MDFRYEELTSNYTVYMFNDYFEPSTLNFLIGETTKFPYASLEGKRTDKIARIWMNQYEHFVSICEHFDSETTKSKFSDITGVDYTHCRTRIELCNDEKGSWLETHGDDPAKLFTFQVYLTDCEKSTVFSKTSSVAEKNSGWFFNNTGTEMHGLPPITSRRSSIIVNYVDETWRDSSVLVGC